MNYRVGQPVKIISIDDRCDSHIKRQRKKQLGLTGKIISINPSNSGYWCTYTILLDNQQIGVFDTEIELLGNVKINNILYGS